MSDNNYKMEVGVIVSKVPITLKTIEERMFRPDTLEFTLKNKSGSVASSMTANNLSSSDAIHIKNFIDAVYRLAYSDGWGDCFKTQKSEK